MYTVKGLALTKEHFQGDFASTESDKILEYLDAVKEVKQNGKDVHAAAMRIEQHKLTKEHIPTHFISTKEVRFRFLCTENFVANSTCETSHAASSPVHVGRQGSHTR